MSHAKPVSESFRATLERAGGRLRWVIIRVPLDVAQVWGRRGQLKVKGEINGFPFRTSLFPTGQGGHFMMVNKQMQARGKAAPGSTARFRMEPDTEKRVVTPPAELERALAQSKRLQKWHAALSYSTRREIAKWVGEAKQAETRARRAQQMAERLLATMEAERDLPPILKIALARNQKARDGWERMSPGLRRAQLLAIFYYRNPESRARRVAKAVALAAEYTGRRRGARSTPR
jgi:uncharacterized protein YdeI (YjbR/CyaY-like superfamily)